MAVSSPVLADALADIVGGRHVLADRAALDAAAVDTVAPRWVVRAGSAAEVSRLLALASAERLAVAARGSGSAVGLGNPPRRLDVVLDLSRLAGVVDHVAEDMVASVAAGTTLGQLAVHLAPHGQRLALDPPGAQSRTVGGVLACHASGPLRFRYGTGRDLLLGVRFVQADGTVTWGGSRVVKSVTGYDVPKLLVGSLGTIGVIVEATLRLHPTPPATGAWRCSFASGEGAQSFLAAVLASPLEPERLVVVNASTGRSAGWPGTGVAVLVGIASVEEAVVSQGQALTALARRDGADVTSFDGEAAGGAGWSALARPLAADALLKVSGRIERLIAWMSRVEDLAARAGLDAAIVGQAGNGVLHVALRGGPSDDRMSGAISADALAQVVAPLRGELRDEGGSLIVERAPRSAKAGLDVWGPVDPDALGIMKRIKQEFDPLGILNPGRFAGGL